MKHVWALTGTLILSTAVVGSGVAADAAIRPQSGTASSTPSVSPELAAVLPEQGFYWQLTTPQVIAPGDRLLARGTKKPVARGTRSDKQFFEISRTGDNDVPEAALRAYRRAEKVMATADPDCDISWTFLAAIGRVESDHGRYGGAQLSSDAVSRPKIIGPRLDGAGPFAAIRDSEKGAMDGDKLWDRAVGQMQFLPTTWRSVARDGDGDGVRNPHDLDDSALSAAVYLCGAGGSLADVAGRARAAFRYNHSDYYVALVQSFETGFRTGAFVLPSPPPPPATEKPARAQAAKAGQKKPGLAENDRKKKIQAKGKRPAAAPKPATPPVPKPSATATPSSKPTPKPSPTPSPKPTPPAGPKLVHVDGTWNDCGGNFCLGGTPLDLGPAGQRGDRAEADFDGDGSVESNAEEFAGLVGRRVNLQVERAGGELVVYVIGGRGYRNADGSFARSQSVGTPGP